MAAACSSPRRARAYSRTRAKWGSAPSSRAISSCRRNIPSSVMHSASRVHYMRYYSFTMKKLLVAAVSIAYALAAGAQNYPVKPVRIVVPFPAGGGVDLTARTVGQKLTEYLGQQVVIDNRAGAAGTIGAEHVAKSPPRGHTLVVARPRSVAGAAPLVSKLRYNPP